MRVRVAVVAVILAILHFVIHVGLGWGASAPDLLVLAVLLFARETGMGWAALSGFVAGLLEDALSVLAFGANTLALAVVAAAGARTRDLFVGDSRLFAFSYLFLGKWARDLIHWVAVGEELREPFVQALVVESLPAAALVAVTGLVVLWVLGASPEPSGGR